MSYYPPRQSTIFLSDKVFVWGLSIILASYLFFIIALIGYDIFYMIDGSAGNGNPILNALSQPEIRYSIILSLLSCSLTAFLSLGVAIPIGYILARYSFKGKNLLDAILDIPIVLPPLVIGISLLIMFQFPPFSTPFAHYLPVDKLFGMESFNELVVYQIPAVILAQFFVAAAFAIRTMKATFEHINPRCEQVALSLGCNRLQAFSRVVLPESASGIVTAWTLAWARSLGEFGPLLVFAGATRGKTEVLSTTVFLELSVGNLETAVAVSLIMIISAISVLIVARLWGNDSGALL